MTDEKPKQPRDNADESPAAEAEGTADETTAAAEAEGAAEETDAAAETAAVEGRGTATADGAAADPGEGDPSGDGAAGRAAAGDAAAGHDGADEAPAAAASAEAPPADGAPLEALRAEACSKLAIGELRLFEAAPGRFFAAAQVPDKTDAKTRASLALELWRHFRAAGVVVYPALYLVSDWQRLEQAAPKRWTDLLSDDARARQLREIYRTGRPYPKALRGLLVEAAHEYQHFTELVEREAPFALPYLALLATAMMRDALELLFASHGLRFAEENAAEVFEREIADGRYFTRDQLLLYFRLRAISAQARQFNDLGCKLPDRRFDWPEIVRQLRRFFRGFEQVAYEQLSTARERRFRRLLRFAIPSAIGVLLLVGAVWGYLAVQPESPLPNGEKVCKHKGGITGTYFKGKFAKQVAKRVDRSINFSTAGRIEPKAGSDHFSVRWQGYIYFARDGRNYVCVEGDDRLTLWINGEQRADSIKKSGHAMKRDCSTIYVKRGWYPLKLELMESSGAVHARLYAGLEERRVRLVSPHHLCCTK